MIKKLLLTSAFGLILSPLAHATPIDTEVFTLNTSAAFGGATAGTVTLTQVEGTNSVHISVQLNSNFSFRSNTDPQHTGFAFDVTGISSALVASNISTGWVFAGPGSFNDTPYNSFTYSLDCSSPTCVNGPTKGSAQDLTSLQFNLTATGLTISDFVSNGSAVFAADLLQYKDGGGTQTGAIVALNGPGITVTNTDPSPVPEPSSLALLGTGLAGMAEMIRRRMR